MSPNFATSNTSKRFFHSTVVNPDDTNVIRKTNKFMRFPDDGFTTYCSSYLRIIVLLQFIQPLENKRDLTRYFNVMLDPSIVVGKSLNNFIGKLCPLVSLICGCFMYHPPLVTSDSFNI